MQKTKKVKRPSPVKEIDSATVEVTETITDQNSGLQQLYENRKPRTPVQADSIAVAKKVRQNSQKKMNKRLLNSRKPKRIIHEKAA